MYRSHFNFDIFIYILKLDKLGHNLHFFKPALKRSVNTLHHAPFNAQPFSWSFLYTIFFRNLKKSWNKNLIFKKVQF